MPDQKITQLAAGTPALAADELPIANPSRSAVLNYVLTANDLAIYASSRQTFNVLDYGAKGDGVTDDYTAILNAHTAAAAVRGTVYFPHGVTGVYIHSIPFSFTDTLTSWRGEAGTRFKYTGGATAYQFTFNGDGAANGKQAFLRNLVFDGNGLCTNGLLLRLLVGGLVENVRVTNVTSTGVVGEAITTSVLFNIAVSSNIEAFSTVPTTGILFQAVSSGPHIGQSGGDVIIINPKIEGVSGIGIDIGGAQGTTILGGTSEGVGTGLRLTTGSLLTTVIGLDCEANTVRDLDIATGQNTFINCILASHGGGVTEAVKLRNNARSNQFHNGYLWNVVIDAGAQFNQFIGAVFTGTGTQIADSGTSTTLLSCYNLNANAMINSTVWGQYTFNNNLIGLGTLDLTGNLYERGNINFLNKAASGWLSLAFRNTTGSEAVMDMSNIGTLAMVGLFFPQAAPTVSAPAWVQGGVYYDTTLKKLRIGGASGWETVTSV